MMYLCENIPRKPTILLLLLLLQGGGAHMWKSEDYLRMLVLAFHHVGLRDWTPINRLQGKHLDLLSHFAVLKPPTLYNDYTLFICSQHECVCTHIRDQNRTSLMLSSITLYLQFLETEFLTEMKVPL